MKPRPIKIVGDTAYIALTKGYVAVIDAADVPLIEGWNWSASVDGNTVYAVRKITGEKRTMSLHRYLLGAKTGLDVDHQDANGLNNKRANIRIATRSQNLQNAAIHSNNTSGVKGVYWHARTNKWRARVTAGGKTESLGYFHTLEAAASARVLGALSMHGDFARIR